MCNLFICLEKKQLVILVFHSCWKEIPSQHPNTKWGPQVAKKNFFFARNGLKIFFYKFQTNANKRQKKIFFGLCENLVKILGGVEIFSPESPENFFWYVSDQYEPKRKKNFFGHLWPQNGSGRGLRKKILRENGAKIQKSEKSTRVRSQCATFLKKEHQDRKNDGRATRSDSSV